MTYHLSLINYCEINMNLLSHDIFQTNFIPHYSCTLTFSDIPCLYKHNEYVVEIHSDSKGQSDTEIQAHTDSTLSPEPPCGYHKHPVSSKTHPAWTLVWTRNYANSCGDLVCRGCGRQQRKTSITRISQCQVYTNLTLHSSIHETTPSITDKNLDPSPSSITSFSQSHINTISAPPSSFLHLSHNLDCYTPIYCCNT
ncbi:hypothetical protein GEMRC1_000508 [Eukaryota sp. GEM-RC1]